MKNVRQTKPTFIQLRKKLRLVVCNPMNSALFIIAILALSSCAAPPRHEATKGEIENTAKRLITRRESWAAKAQLRLDARQDESDGTWRVTADALDPRHTECGCLLFVPGSSRELLFSRSGRLISYVPVR